MKKYIEEDYNTYLTQLKHLIAINTVFDNQEGVNEALQFCREYFSKYLGNNNTYFDSKNNLICCPKKINQNEDLLYLSAHIDTVPADKTEWDKKYDPFVSFEDEKEIVGRGANDCKAGVAYQLFLAKLIAEHFPNSTNIVFTISSREENGGDSAREIALQIGRKLPISNKIYLINLENNVTIQPPTLAINYGERGSIGIEAEATLDIIRNFLMQDKNEWNPTVIKPLESDENGFQMKLHQVGGHAATTPREKNILYKLLLEHDSYKFLLQAGSTKLVSAVPSIIRKTVTTIPVKHKIIFDLRTFKKTRDLKLELGVHQFAYRFIKKFDYGYDIKGKFLQDKIYQVMNNIAIKDDIKVTFEVNPGTTDTGKIYSSIDEKLKDSFMPITLGPGSRSQRNKIPPRLSHGVNETYDKEAGLSAIIFISDVLMEMKFLQ